MAKSLHAMISDRHRVLLEATAKHRGWTFTVAVERAIELIHADAGLPDPERRRVKRAVSQPRGARGDRRGRS